MDRREKFERSVFEGMLFIDYNKIRPISDKEIANDFFYYDFGFFNVSERILLSDEKVRSGLFDLISRVSKDHDIEISMLKGNAVFARGYSGVEDNEGLEEDEESSKQRVYSLSNMIGVYLRKKVFLDETALNKLQPMEDLSYASNIIRLMQC